MNAGDVQTLFVHMEWADAAAWKVVLAIPATREDAKTKELLQHLHTVQWVYLQVWRGEPLQVPDFTGFPDAAWLSRWATSYYPALRAFSHTLDDAALSRQLDFPWADEVVKRLGTAGPATLAESIWQVVLHTTYHRAQVATRLREFGVEPPLTDFIAWAWRNRPQPEWPA